jgi:hypothetical protein
MTQPKTKDSVLCLVGVVASTMQPHQTGGPRMSSTQLQEPNNIQHFRDQMQAQMPQQQQAVAAQQQMHRILMSQSLHHFQHPQFSHQHWANSAGSQQG